MQHYISHLENKRYLNKFYMLIIDVMKKRDDI